MIINNQGYIFECRYDSNMKVGVMEAFKVQFKDKYQRVSITLCIDNYGKVLVPAKNNLSLGFEPLSASCTSKENVDEFCRSNKPYFGKVGEFSMIASGTIVYDKDTKELVSTDNLGFYVPKVVSKSVSNFIDKKGVQHPALICEKLSTSEGLNLFKVSESIYNSYLQNFLSSIDAKAAESRNTFLSTLILA